MLHYTLLEKNSEPQEGTADGPNLEGAQGTAGDFSQPGGVRVGRRGEKPLAEQGRRNPRAVGQGSWDDSVHRHSCTCQKP